MEVVDQTGPDMQIWDHWLSITQLEEKIAYNCFFETGPAAQQIFQLIQSIFMQQYSSIMLRKH